MSNQPPGDQALGLPTFHAPADSSAPKTVTLTSGIEADATFVNTVTLVLRMWLDDGVRGVLIAYDVAMLARDPDYKPFGSNGEAIEKAGFLDGFGKLHRSIADIIKCALVGEGMALEFVNPVKH